MIPESHPFSNFLLSLQALFDGVLGFGESILSPGWRQNQILILLALVALAWVLHRVTGVMLQNWVRSREGWSKWQLRVVVQVKRRLGLIWFALSAGLLYQVMQNVTWPSRSYLIGLAATLAAIYVSPPIR